MLSEHSRSELQGFVDVVTFRLYEAAVHFNHGIVEDVDAVRLKEEMDLVAYAIGVAALNNAPLVVPQVIRLCVPELEAGTLRWEMIRRVPYPSLALPDDNMGLSSWWSDGGKTTATGECSAHLEQCIQSLDVAPYGDRWDIAAKIVQDSKSSDGRFMKIAENARRIALQKQRDCAALSSLLDDIYTA
ncbi:hypothetical protein FA95DRAFT_1576463 [Auriscalpium vulgare]|uniref:Uncharacterized protein n=1 Tax=Auriscalpium vulgare TaxID=40419 RepID=A0ACB8RAU0_9AGAM|nr:hypothetical protein FA95DRAFT_1576463 [Auriscalpium vulgare]